MADDKKKGPMKTYLTRHTIHRPENGVNRVYAPNQSIELTDEDAKKLLAKKAIWADRKEAEAAAKAEVEGVKSDQGSGETEVERDARLAREADEQTRAATATREAEERAAIAAAESGKKAAATKSVV